MLLLKPGFSPLGVTRLYTHSRSQMFVFMFHESRRTLKFGANSMFAMSTFAAPVQSDTPDALYPVKPSPVRMLAPSVSVQIA